MGILYEMYNFTRKEYTEIGKHQVNTKDWHWSPLANFYVWMRQHFWSDTDEIHLIPDTRDSYYDLRETFKDITEKAINEYNLYVDESIEFYVKEIGFPHDILKKISKKGETPN